MPDQPSDTFAGYPRAQGRAGVRNHLLILSATGLTGPTARRIASQVTGALVVCNPVDTGPLGEDRAANLRALNGFITHPNVGGVVIIGGNRPKVRQLTETAAASGRLVEGIALDDCGHDAMELTLRAVRAAAELSRQLSAMRREPVPVAELFVGLECGRSDPSSGLVANPLFGRFADRLVDAGGSAVLGETTEWLGAEHLLAARAENDAVADDIRNAAARREQMARDAGIDLIGNNPGPTNVEAGLSSIEEKSLGNIAKSGSRPIRSVIGWAEAPAVPGLHLMDAPAYAPESLTGFVAAGAQLALFSTGVGNSYTSLLAPTVKVSANPDTTGTLRTQLDFDASSAFTGEQAMDAVAHDFWDEVLAVAGGVLTYGEILGEGDEVISRFGAAL